LQRREEVRGVRRSLSGSITALIVDQRVLLLIYVSAVLIVTIQRGVFGFPNEFAIFRTSFWNLLGNKDLYVLRLDQAHDYFKYSPSFALLFAPLLFFHLLSGSFSGMPSTPSGSFSRSPGRYS
jgi:hypothetical protein